jgi:hypothetical protein
MASDRCRHRIVLLALFPRPSHRLRCVLARSVKYADLFSNDLHASASVHADTSRRYAREHPISANR